MKGYRSGYIRTLNAANYAVKRALGAATALAANKLRKGRKGSKTQTAKGGRRRRYTKTARAGAASVTMTRRKKRVFDNHATENTFRSLTVPARKPSAYKLVTACMEPQWWRVQGLTQYDTNYGFYAIANRLQQNGSVLLPMHFWDITSSPNVVAGVPSYPNAGFGTYFSNTTSGANASSYTLQSQIGTGTTTSNTNWVVDNIGSGTTEVTPYRKAYHHWTHIKMNLYGVRKRATRYVVQLVIVKDTLADFINAGATNTNKRKLFDYLTRPFMYNNLQSGDPQALSDIKILKTYDVMIDPISTDNYGGESNAVPHIQTLNWFVNHNRIRRYDWIRGEPGSHTQDAGWDPEDSSGHDMRVDPRFRVYLLVRALSPERRALADNNAFTEADPISEPSYDIVIRNKFSVPV